MKLKQILTLLVCALIATFNFAKTPDEVRKIIEVCKKYRIVGRKKKSIHKRRFTSYDL